MAILFPTPIYRFFSKYDYVKSMINDGEIFFNTVHAFTELDDKNFTDESERYYNIKHVYEEKENKHLSITNQHRKIINAWAFCGTTSSCSSAKKKYCVWIKDFHSFISQIEIAVIEKFGSDALIMFGPVHYKSKGRDAFSKVIYPPYFTKSEDKSSDLEFRVVIPPMSFIDESEIVPMTIKISNPKDVFEEVLLI